VASKKRKGLTNK